MLLAAWGLPVLTHCARPVEVHNVRCQQTHAGAAGIPLRHLAKEQRDCEHTGNTACQDLPTAAEEVDHPLGQGLAHLLVVDRPCYSICAGCALVESVSRVAKSASAGTVSPSRPEDGCQIAVVVIVPC
jgi:hypothetical protein